MATKKKPSDFKALMLRTCDADMSAHGGFVWPTSGYVKALDWNPEPVCGGGLHGALWGEGDGSLFEWSSAAKWLVCGINKWVDLDGKVKTDRAYVLYCGDRTGATAYIQRHGARGAVIGGTATAGHRGTATAGHRGTATAGHRGTATAGHRGTATAGDYGTATAGYGGTATAGDGGTATAGHRGTATAGYGGTATAGYGGTATAGDGGTATAGYRGTATAGYGGTATAGDYGTATAGHRGTLVIKWWDGSRYRLSVGYVGDGIEPNVKYKLDSNGKFIKA